MTTNGAPHLNEANGLKNTIYTVAMDPNSATAQSFINVKDNDFLDYTSPTLQGWGYAVLGGVVKGRKTAMKIARVPAGFRGLLPTAVPLENVVIERATLLNK
ncbi:MAG: peptidylprolyl isomerase [Betaproteobacteria bacterium]|nr:peptidylprolyl isomerase [Betaproteobacteria bacterium]